MRSFTTGLLSLGLAAFAAALCWAAPEPAPQIVLRPGMEWHGSFARETIDKNAAYKLQSKTHARRVDPFRMRITEVNGSTITGEFAWHTHDEGKAVRFKGTLKPNGQFSFPVTAVLKGTLGTKVIGSAILGGFGPDAETVKGTIAFAGRRITAFEAELTKSDTKGRKKGG